MTFPEAVFHETTAERRVEAVGLSHLSLGLGQVRIQDLAADPESLRRHFNRVAPWARTARQNCAESLAGRKARISTCLLVDDYFTQISSPDIVIPQLVQAAAEAELTIDYLMRQSACVDADDVPVALLVKSRLVDDPVPGTNGSRPPATQIGWLCNGQRSPAGSAAEAMAFRPWAPPAQNVPDRHTIFVDIELWDDLAERRTWSRAFLAAVWQLLRLGMLRDLGSTVVTPRQWTGELPGRWDVLPPVLTINPAAAPFAAYQTLCILPPELLAEAYAARTILSQVMIDSLIRQQVQERAAGEGFALADDLLDRISYVLTR